MEITAHEYSMSLPAQHGLQATAQSQELGKGLFPLPPDLSYNCNQGTCVYGYISGHFRCHKEVLVLGYPDSPALAHGQLSKAHIKVWS